MQTAEKNANSVQGTTAKNNQTVNRIENRPILTGKEAKQDETEDQTAAQTTQGEKTNPAEIKTGSHAAVDNESAHVAPHITGQEVCQKQTQIQ